MSRRILDFTEEPRGDFLRHLLVAAGERAARVVLVIRDDVELSERGNEVLSALDADLIERTRGASWPGTTLLKEQATILHFAATHAVIETLASATVGLYGWQQPELPEDPALLRSDGSAILATVAHEGDAYLEVDDDELAQLASAVPGLSNMTHEHTEET